MDRPKLSTSLTVDSFRTHYWLKSELADFCRAHGVQSSGSKAEIANRIENHLNGVSTKVIPKRSKGKSTM
ncbi:MAG: SAP domain-containing protein, partial [Pseudomonadota bacterium]